MLTPFQKKVYTIVKQIPMGETRTYRWVAHRLKAPSAQRAIGQALKKNPYPIIVPCHRVIREGGFLGGYAWGRDLKRKLLEIERNRGK